GGPLTPPEAVRSPLPWATLAAAGHGDGFEAGHPLAWIVPIPPLQLLLQVADAGFQLRDQRPLLGNDRLQLLNQLTLANHQVHQLGVRQGPGDLAGQRHSLPAYPAIYSPR